VDLEHLGLAREFDPNVVQHRLQTTAERVELLPRIPDLADAQVPLRAESDVMGEALRRPAAGLLEAADAFVLLLRRHGRCGCEAGKDARFAIAHRRGRRPNIWPFMASFVWMLPTEPTYNRTLFDVLAWRARNLSQKTPPTVSAFPLTGY
jgi:hypothetical protein